MIVLDNDIASFMASLTVDQASVFEETCLSVGYRRVFAISQSLSIAVNAVLLKLNLVIEGQIPGMTIMVFVFVYLRLGENRIDC